MHLRSKPARLTIGINQALKYYGKFQKEGYASPAIANNILVLFHREDGFEQIEGLHADSGKIIWTHKYEVEYRDRYGYSNGPRASPVIENNLVYSLGVTSWLSCLNLKTGKLIWNRDLKSEFKIPDYFFGKGANPIVFKNKLIVNVGEAITDA